MGNHGTVLKSVFYIFLALYTKGSSFELVYIKYVFFCYKETIKTNVCITPFLDSKKKEIDR